MSVCVQLLNVDDICASGMFYNTNSRRPKACPASLCLINCSLVPRVSTTWRDGWIGRRPAQCVCTGGGLLRIQISPKYATVMLAMTKAVLESSKEPRRVRRGHEPQSIDHWL